MRSTVGVLALFLITLTVSAGCSLIGLGEGGADGMSLILVADRASYAQGDPIEVTLTLRNDGEDSELANARMAANQPAAPDMVREVVFIVTDPSGQTLPVAARINVRPPQEADFQILVPGHTVARSYDLTTLFAFDQSGDYSVRAIYQNSQDPPSGRSAWKGEIESHTIVVTVE